MGRTHQMGVHITQKHQQESNEEAKHFMEMMHEKVVQIQIDPDDVINMDQMPISFELNRVMEKWVKRPSTSYLPLWILSMQSQMQLFQ